MGPHRNGGAGKRISTTAVDKSHRRTVCVPSLLFDILQNKASMAIKTNQIYMLTQSGDTG